MFGDPIAALALACTLVAIVACIAAGSVIAAGPSRWPGADMLVGFGLLTGAAAILAVTTRVPLSWLMVGLAHPAGDCTSHAAAISRRAIDLDRVGPGFANSRQGSRQRTYRVGRLLELA